MLCAECEKEIPDKQEIIYQGTCYCKDCYKKTKTILLIIKVITGLAMIATTIYICYLVGKMSKD